MPIWIKELLKIIVAPLLKDWLMDSLKGDKVGLNHQKKAVDRAIKRTSPQEKKQLKKLQAKKKEILREMNKCDRRT
jgi:hypothetical protein